MMFLNLSRMLANLLSRSLIVESLEIKSFAISYMMFQMHLKSFSVSPAGKSSYPIDIDFPSPVVTLKVTYSLKVFGGPVDL